jgi:hypothetical protein
MKELSTLNGDGTRSYSAELHFYGITGQWLTTFYGCSSNIHAKVEILWAEGAARDI